MSDVTVPEPFAIHLVAHKYILYDAPTVAYVRREYNIGGTLIGGLPQAPQQNVFLGIPLELMPEEARLLVEKGAAYIVDDARQHKQAFLSNGLSGEEAERFRRTLDKQGTDAAKLQAKKAGERKEEALKKIAEKEGKTENWNDLPEDMLSSRLGVPRAKGKKNRSRSATPMVTTPTEERAEPNMSKAPPPSARPPPPRQGQDTAQVDDETNLFSSSSSAPHEPQRNSPASQPEAFKITPTTSYPPLASLPSHEEKTPDVPSSYPLFRHLHEKSYFLAPGLRFGCQYTAYPGDPLRYHSHFLCKGLGWDDEFDLLELIGGGRLGTGVKKGFLLGGEDPKMKAASTQESRDGVRTFCIEWAGM